MGDIQLKHIGVPGMKWHNRSEQRKAKIASERKKPKNEKTTQSKKVGPTKKLEIGKRKLAKLMAGTIGTEKVSGLKKMSKDKAINVLKKIFPKYGSVKVGQVSAGE